jgi:hypothetical protein
MIEPGSEVHTDGWRGYNGLSASGFKHKVVRETPDLGDNLLPLANRVASLLKRWLLGTHQGAVQSSHLDYYLDEYTFRFNRRTSKSRGLLFYRLISQAVHLGPILGSEISGVIGQAMALASVGLAAGAVGAWLLTRLMQKLLFGVVHLGPLPGAPRWRGDLEALIKLAMNDARAYERGGDDSPRKACADERFATVAHEPAEHHGGRHAALHL